LAPLPSYRVQLCGALVVEGDGQRLETRLPGRQGRLLFAYLVVNRHRVVGRDELAEAVWPDQLPSAPANALNALISKTRRAFGPTALDGRSYLQLHLDPAWVDVEAAAAAIHRAESAVALESWARAWGPALVALFVTERDFLPGDDAPWIDEQRRHLGEIRVRALEAYGTAALGIGGTELAAADRAFRTLIRQAPLRESGYRSLMRTLAAQGNVAEALRVYTTLCDTLAEQLGVAPSPTTREVYEQLVVT
jgi:DNA-binding SARP family transcriptional activator